MLCFGTVAGIEPLVEDFLTFKLSVFLFLTSFNEISDKMRFFAKIVYGFKKLALFAKTPTHVFDRVLNAPAVTF